jgi:hypothetical protein
MNGLPLASRALGDTPTFPRSVSLTAASVAVEGGAAWSVVTDTVARQQIAVAAQDGMNAFVGVSLKSSAIAINGILRAPLIASAIAIKPQALPQVISDVLASASMAVAGRGTTSALQDHVGLASIAINAKYLVIGAGALLEPVGVAINAKAATGLIRDSITASAIAVAINDVPQNVSKSVTGSARMAVNPASLTSNLISPLARQQVAIAARGMSTRLGVPLAVSGIALVSRVLPQNMSGSLEKTAIATRARVLPGFLRHPLTRATIALHAQVATTKLHQRLDGQAIAIQDREPPQVIRAPLSFSKIAVEGNGAFDHVFSVAMEVPATIAIAPRRGGGRIGSIDPAQKWRILTIHDGGRAIIVSPETRR